MKAFEKLLFLLIKLSVFTLLPSYIYFMVIEPLSSFDWGYIQRVWHSWQSFNVGMLAFLSTCIIFLHTHNKSESHRRRELVASLAFLPSAFVAVSDYLKGCVPTLEEAYERVLSGKKSELKRKLDNEPPYLPQTFQPAFKECIRYAEDKEGELLSEILRKLQIQNSRIRSLYEDEICEESKTYIDESAMRGHFDDIVYIKALIDILYPYARGGDIESPTVNRRIAGSALASLKVSTKFQDALREFMDNIYKGERYEFTIFKRKGVKRTRS